MQLGFIHKLLLPLVMCAALTAAAAQNSAGRGEGGCGQIASQLPQAGSTFAHGVGAAPRNAIRLRNLKWELPIAAATGWLIATSDHHINSHIQSPSFVSASTLGSNVGLGIELGTAGMMYLVGCPRDRQPYAANTGWVALEAIGAASLMNYGIKVATNRQYAYTPNTHGEFWEGGKSFPSGHAAASFAFASVVAHRYPRSHWLKWSVYGLATGVSLARAGGKKHFASDILVGSTLGYVTGTYLASH